MPQTDKFFFDVVWKGLRSRDDVGLRLESGLAVRNAAIHAAVEHAIDLSGDQQGQHEVEVRDGNGGIVLRVTLQYEAFPVVAEVRTIT